MLARTRTPTPVAHDDNGFPIAYVERRGQPGRWYWRVIVCPWCHVPAGHKHQHLHGAGSAAHPQLLGPRTPHCFPQDLAKVGLTRGDLRDYVLVEAEQEVLQ